MLGSKVFLVVLLLTLGVFFFVVARHACKKEDTHCPCSKAAPAVVLLATIGLGLAAVLAVLLGYSVKYAAKKVPAPAAPEEPAAPANR